MNVEINPSEYKVLIVDDVINFPVNLLQKATGRTNIFDNKMPDTTNNLRIIRR